MRWSPCCAVPTPFNFLSRFLKACGAGKDNEVQSLAAYLTELALPDYPMLKFSYSETAAAAVYVANRHVSPYCWLLQVVDSIPEGGQVFSAVPTCEAVQLHSFCNF